MKNGILIFPLKQDNKYTAPLLPAMKMLSFFITDIKIIKIFFYQFSVVRWKTLTVVDVFYFKGNWNNCLLGVYSNVFLTVLFLFQHLICLFLFFSTLFLFFSTHSHPIHILHAVSFTDEWALHIGMYLLTTACEDAAVIF